VRATGAVVGTLVFAGGVCIPAQALAADPTPAPSTGPTPLPTPTAVPTPVPLDGASTTLNYQCTMPIIGDQPVMATVRTNIPSSWPKNTLTPRFDIAVDARAKGDTWLGLTVVGAAPGGTLTGQGDSRAPGGVLTQARLAFPSASGNGTLPLSVPLTITPTSIPMDDPGADGLRIPAFGTTPKVMFPMTGSAQAYIDGVAMSLVLRDATGAVIEGLGDPGDSDGDWRSFDLPCSGNAVKLADITVTDGPDVPPPTPTPAPTPAPTPTPTPAPPTPTPTPAPPTPTLPPPPPTPTPSPAPQADPTNPVLAQSCTVPIIGDQPVRAQLSTNAPSRWPAGTPLTGVQMGLDAKFAGDTYLGMQIVGAAPGGTLEGSATITATFKKPSGQVVPLAIPVPIAPHVLPDVDPGYGFNLRGLGTIPELQADGLGAGTLTITGLQFNLLAKQADGAIVEGLGDPADGDRNALTFDVPCSGAGAEGPTITFDDGDAPTVDPLPVPTATPVPSPSPTPVPTPTRTPIPPTPTPSTGPTPLPTPTPTPGGLSGASGQLNYWCAMPIIGDQPVVANVRTNIPYDWPAATLTPSFAMQVDAHLKGDTYLGLSIMGAAPGGTLVGQGKAGSALAGGGLLRTRLVLPTTTGAAGSLPLTVPLNVPSARVPDADPGAEGVAVSASGAVPKFSIPAPGTAQLFVDSLAMSLQARDASGSPIEGLGYSADSDGDALTFDVPCTGPTVKLAEITVNSAGPVPSTTPTTLPPTPLPPTPTPGIPAGGPTPTPVPGATATPTPTPTPIPTPVGTPTPTPTPAPPAQAMRVTGSTELKTLVRGSLPLTGQLGPISRTPQGGFGGNLSLDPVAAKLRAVGAIPLSATVAFLPQGPLTGTITAGTYKGSVKETIKLTKVTLFGIPLGVGSTCQTKSPSDFQLTGPLSTVSGGTITATYAISSLTGCGPLTPLIGTAIAGKGNTISLTLKP
jgi:hypothetical protein